VKAGRLDSSTEGGTLPELPVVAIVGSPNVGKSTLFNRLVGRRTAIVTDEPGVTRDRLYGVARGEATSFRVADTGGIVPGEGTPLARDILRQAEAALAEASAVLFVVDARAGLTRTDREVASLLRKRSLPVVLVANKVDAESVEPFVSELYEAGLGDPVPVSAAHGLGIGDLLDRVETILAGAEAPPEGPLADEEVVRVALVGRPNVGKSSILNRLVGEERMLVSDVPGTTRDSVDTRIERGERRYLLVDTAGIRRRGRVEGEVETLSAAGSRASIERADVVVLVLDAEAGIVAQDAHIAGYAHDAVKPVAIVVNKWDLVPEKEEAAKTWAQEARHRFPFLKEAPVVLTSARTGQRVSRILDVVDELHRDAAIRVPTPQLNRWLEAEARAERGAPAKGRSVRLFYAAQTGIRPPRFVLFCNDARRVHFSLRRRLENSLRERFSFGSAPIRLSFRSRREAGKR
jgi:GTP-binding protein